MISSYKKLLNTIYLISLMVIVIALLIIQSTKDIIVASLNKTAPKKKKGIKQSPHARKRSQEGISKQT
ncbi:MAG: hypothetical protein DSZ06_00195 [Sulfurospirillum sp.]|nr:MAG: hypothetical protein DSZ06_00195 [Sulfurospirillum sp.]